MFQKMLQVGNSGGGSDKDYTFLENVIPFRQTAPYTISDEGEYIAIYSVYRTNDSSDADIIPLTSDLTMELISRGIVKSSLVYTTVYKITTNSPNQQIYGSKTTNDSLLIILKKS